MRGRSSYNVRFSEGLRGGLLAVEGRLAKRNRDVIVRDERDKIVNYFSEKIGLLVPSSFCLLFSAQHFYNLLY